MISPNGEPAALAGCLTAFVFSLAPLVIHEVGASPASSISWSSLLLGISIMTQGGLAGRRDRRLKRAGAAYPVERRVVAAACLAILVAVAPILDSAGVLPGSSAG